MFEILIVLLMGTVCACSVLSVFVYFIEKPQQKKVEKDEIFSDRTRTKNKIVCPYCQHEQKFDKNFLVMCSLDSDCNEKCFKCECNNNFECQDCNLIFEIFVTAEHDFTVRSYVIWA